MSSEASAPPSAADARAKREAEALRRNLARRKRPAAESEQAE